MTSRRASQGKAADEAGFCYDRSIVIDGCGGPPGIELGPLRAGVTAMHITLSYGQSKNVFDDTLRAIHDHYVLVEELAGAALVVETVADIHRAKSSGALGLIFALQDCALIGHDIYLLEILKRLGLRVIQLTYNEENQIGDGCLATGNRELTHFGKRVVRELNRLGIVIDLSHTGIATSLSAIETSTLPPIFSHSNAYALTPNPRCINDSQIRAIAAAGGVIGVSPFAPMCTNRSTPPPNLEDYLRHVEYMADLAGTDHVAIGTDIFERLTALEWNSTSKRSYPEVMGSTTFDTLYCDGFTRIDDLGSIASALLERSFSASEVAGIMGGNLLRIYEACWSRGKRGEAS